jgi:hypothetical protein
VCSDQTRLASNLLAALVSSSVECMHGRGRQARMPHAWPTMPVHSPALPLLHAIGLANHMLYLCPTVRCMDSWGRIETAACMRPDSSKRLHACAQTAPKEMATCAARAAHAYGGRRSAIMHTLSHIGGN